MPNIIEYFPTAKGEYVPNARKKYMTSFMTSLMKSTDDIEITKILINHGADVNAKDNIGRTPLHTTHSPEIASLLLEAGANPHLNNIPGLSAIDVRPAFFKPEIIEQVYNKAFREKNIKAIENIGRHFPDIFTRITHEQQHLREAIQSNDTELAQTLITQKAYVNITLQGGNTPLHWAAANGFVDMVKLITPQIADINVRNAGGKTALYLAVERGDLAMATHLISHNADVNIPDKDGHSPLDIAIDKKFTQIGALLVSNDAEANKPLTNSHQAALAKSRAGGGPSSHSR